MKRPKQFKRNSNPNAKKFVRRKKEEEKTAYKGYDAKWNRYRFRFLHHNPKCYSCGRSRGEVSIHVDHLIPHKGDKELFWKVDNYIPLCINCHSFVTAKFDVQTPPDTNGKLKWLSEERKRRGTTVKVKVVPFKGENV